MQVPAWSVPEKLGHIFCAHDYAVVHIFTFLLFQKCRTISLTYFSLGAVWDFESMRILKMHPVDQFIEVAVELFLYIYGPQIEQGCGIVGIHMLNYSLWMM